MGSKRKGMSLDDKRTKMLELFHEKKDFFQLKELEKMGPHEKGIVMQSVKDVVKGLQDDGLVHSDKIGSSVYFWSLPSQVTGERKRKFSDLEQDLDSVKGKIEDAQSNAKKAKISQGNSEERVTLMTKLTKLKAEHKEIMEKVAAIQECDPRRYEQDQKDLKVGRSGVERWKDNIESCRRYLKDKFNMCDATIQQYFGLKDED